MSGRATRQSAAEAGAQERQTNIWLQAVVQLYPDALERTYCVPPVHFNRVPYRATTVACQSALVHSQTQGHLGQPLQELDNSNRQQQPSRHLRHVDVQCLPIRLSRARWPLSPDRHDSNPPQYPQHPPFPQPGQAVWSSLQRAAPPPWDHSLQQQPHHHQQQPLVNAYPPVLGPHGVLRPLPMQPQYTECTWQNHHHYHPAYFGQQGQGVDPLPAPGDLAERMGKLWIQQPPGRDFGHNATSLYGRVGEEPKIQRPLWNQLEMPDGYPKEVRDSDFRDDRAQQHVLFSLQTVGDRAREVMLILSQLRFSDYLCRSSYAAVSWHALRRPGDLGGCYRSGEFDLLLIHRKYGILIGEIKSVGIQQDFQQTPGERDASVMKRVQQCIKQLDRSERVVRFLVADIAGLQLTVRKTLFLPYVSRQQLQRVLERSPVLDQEVRQCLGACSTGEALDWCCTSDTLLEPMAEVTENAFARLRHWWSQRMSPTNTQLDDRLYLHILSRFVGPASSKSVHCVFSPPREIKTDWQAISELGGRLVTLVLTLQQIELLNRAPAKVCITGPPGTGKSIALVLMGLTWLLEGHDVHVLSVFYKSFAASQLIRRQLQKSLEASVKHTAPGRVFFHQYDFYWEPDSHVNLAVQELLLAASACGQLHVLMDEAWFGYQGLSPRYQQLLNALGTRLGTGLHVWAADMGNIEVPRQLQQAVFTVPLRYCSAVLREVQQGISHYSTVPGYTVSGLPAPSEGPNVIRLQHYHSGQEGHEGFWPVQCRQCGINVAAILLRRLAVGLQATLSPDSPPPLQYRDVFILTRSCELQDDVIDTQGRVTSLACSFVQGLRSQGVPVCVLNGTFHDELQWEQDLADVSVGASDWVTVATLGAVNGLERKVVVWLPGRKGSADRNYTDEAIEALDRLASVSRCTTQLVTVHLIENSRDQSTRNHPP